MGLRVPRRPGSRYWIRKGGLLTVWYGHAVSDARRELSLALEHRLEHIRCSPISAYQQVHQFPQYALLILGPQWDPDSVGRQQFGKPQWSVSKCRNRLKIVDLS